MPAQHEFVIVCPATQLLMTLVRLALNPSGGGDVDGDGGGDGDGDVDGGGDDDGDGDRNGWRLDHSRLIGGVNNSVQRRLLCSHPFALLKCFDDAERISARDWAAASSKSVFLMWLVMASKCSGVKFLVFSQFTATLDVLQHLLQIEHDDVPLYRIDGATGDV